uniref:Uncharacterized protein n=1 Tax=Pipistrellus kuhlii TaxID=59472 RepID=A0A7J7UTI9_PIPKU|nr:hypothetical protein mPipKuh1_008723 [Pipistrellus kuhlii]
MWQGRGLGGEGELCDAAGNFPGTQYAPRCHSQKRCPRGWGARWALFSAKAGEGRRGGVRSAPQPSCWPCLPGLDSPLPGPHREGTAQLDLLEAEDLLICTLPVHICMWAGRQMAPSKSRKPSWLWLRENDLSVGPELSCQSLGASWEICPCLSLNLSMDR